MPDPSQVIFSLGSQLWIFFTQIGGVGVIWLMGLYLCYSRRDLPQNPTDVDCDIVGDSIVFDVRNDGGLRGCGNIYGRNRQDPVRDMNWLFGFINYTQAFMKMLAHGLMLYAIFGNFRSQPNWDAVAMESETPEE